MERKQTTVKYTGYKHGDGFFGKYTMIYFTDGKTPRFKQYVENAISEDIDITRAAAIIAAHKPGDRIPAVKLGSGKYAGYTL